MTKLRLFVLTCSSILYQRLSACQISLCVLLVSALQQNKSVMVSLTVKMKVMRDHSAVS